MSPFFWKIGSFQYNSADVIILWMPQGLTGMTFLSYYASVHLLGFKALNWRSNGGTESASQH